LGNSFRGDNVRFLYGTRSRKEDLDSLLELYLFLHEDSIPEHDKHLAETWEQILEDPNHHLIVNEIDGQIVSSCVCVIIPNLTRSVRPYAFVENVVTHAEHRRKGYAGECLTYAKKIAEQENCYKMMLLTGSKKPETLHFYEHAGYNSSDKTAFIQWIGMDK
jgi:GNAT superfamily N-acetyltransferase